MYILNGFKSMTVYTTSSGPYAYGTHINGSFGRRNQ